MTSRLPRLDEFVSVFHIEIIWMFFNFKHFSYDTRWVEGGRGNNFGFFKEDVVLGVVRMFG
jgi:hypothetical protein